MRVAVHLVDASIFNDVQGFNSRSSLTKGDITIQIAAMCNGLYQAITDVRTATTKGQVDALNFYGHGAGGVQGVTMEKDNRGTSEMAAITVDALDRPAVGAQFSALKANFSSKGQIILHGCNVAEGDSGKRLLSKLSKVAGVPVKGSNWYQIVGRSELAGNIVTASPGGSIQEDSFSGLKNLGGLPPGESLLLLGAEFSDRLLKLVGWR